MSEKLSFDQDTFFNFLLNKIIDLETDLALQEMTSKVLFLHLKPEGKEVLKVMRENLAEQRPKFREEYAQNLVASLKSVSNDMDDFLGDLLR